MHLPQQGRCLLERAASWRGASRLSHSGIYEQTSTLHAVYRATSACPLPMTMGISAHVRGNPVMHTLTASHRAWGGTAETENLLMASSPQAAPMGSLSSRTLSREMSVSPDVIREQRWAEAGENLAVLNFSEKVRIFDWSTARRPSLSCTFPTGPDANEGGRCRSLRRKRGT